MLTNFNADAQRAAVSDRPASISESGAYVGIIRQAYTYKTQSGAQMICFNFLDQASGSTAWSDLCILKRNGEAAFGMDIFNALMVCMGTTTASATEGKARNRRGELIDAMRIKGIEQRPLGFVLQKELTTYTDQNGSIRDTYRMNLVKTFDPKTRRTAAEIASGSAEAKNLDNFLKTLKDRDNRGKAQPQQASKPAQAAQAQTQAAMDDNFDDCPW